MSNIHLEISPLPERNPERSFTPEQLVWTDEERARIDAYRASYPEAEAAVMRLLWMAQEKFGWLAPEVIQLVADTLGIPYAHAYGVATFYTMYFKEPKGRFVLDVCTGHSCQVCGAYDRMAHLEKTLGVHMGETTDDGQFTLQEAECLGACGTGPMLQITNGRYVHNLTDEKLDRMVATLRETGAWPFESVTLPQDEDEMQGNRRSDAEATEKAIPAPFFHSLGGHRHDAAPSHDPLHEGTEGA